MIADQFIQEGAKKAAIFMLAIGEEKSAFFLKNLSAKEVKAVAAAMVILGNIPSDQVDAICSEFVASVIKSDFLIGNIENVERLLSGAFAPDKVAEVISEMRAPSSHDMWGKLNNVSESMFANYLINEYPQTVAIILSKLNPQQSSRIISSLPEGMAVDVIVRMLSIGNIPKDVISKIEDTLRGEFSKTIFVSKVKNPYEIIAEIFNSADGEKEKSLMAKISEIRPDEAEKIKSLMFTYEDVCNLPDYSLSMLLSRASRETLVRAMRGMEEEKASRFYGSMSERMRKSLREEISSIPSLRKKDVEMSQSELVQLAKEMIESEEIDYDTDES